MTSVPPAEDVQTEARAVGHEARFVPRPRSTGDQQADDKSAEAETPQQQSDA